MYQKYKNEPNATFEERDNTTYIEVYKPAAQGNNKQKNNWLNILRTHETFEIGIFS